MSLRQEIQKDITTAMKSGDKDRLSALRMLMSAVKYKEVDLRRELGDEEVQQVVSTLMKQRQDSVEQFRKGNREDLAAKEEKELGILKAYMPPQMSIEELREIIKKAAVDSGSSGMKDMGKLMKAVMPLVKGKADGKAVNDIVKETLGG